MKTDNFKFRASQMHKIMSGTIGLTEAKHSRLKVLVKRAWDARSGNDKPLTDNMNQEMSKLFSEKRNLELGKTAQSEYRKVYRMWKYKRSFPMTNKFVQKGIEQEEEAITAFQRYLSEVEGTVTLLKKNEERFEDDFFSGMPDNFDDRNKNLGYDIKAPWNLETFPFNGDELPSEYEYQNQTYMHLTGRKEWWTVSVLVNAGEHQLHNEKQKWFFACQQHTSNAEKYENDYIEKCREVERMMIFDYDRFVELFPFHIMEHTRDEWHKEGFDMPLEDRVVIRKSYYDPEKIKEMKQRVKIGREYIENLENGRKNN